MHGLHENLQFSRFGDHHEDLCSPTYGEKVEIVRLLVEHRADVTAKDKSFSTPLHLASSFGTPEIVRRLIERGADITAEDESRRTPLHLASASRWVGDEALSPLLCLTSLMLWIGFPLRVL